MAKNVVGTRNNLNYFSAIDLKPSILDFVGLEKEVGQVTDGESILPTLLGRTNKSRKSPICWARPPDRKNFKGFDKPLPDIAIREGDYKLLCDFDGKRPELYDLKKDPEESKNLSQLYPNKVKHMSRRVIEWYKDISHKG
ncbi:MAG: hypothetical protein EOP48_09140 [Sphingobacteriales bacterium]|nr:MAG: hypothetical protein EOP48_09140 [Sphingobacteriales bacterium]